MKNTAFSSTGARDGYRWHQSAQHFLHELLEHVPSLVVGRYVAVTSFDSGPLQLGDDERRGGWTSTDGVAYSPRITDPREIPSDGYDEWYVFRSPIRLAKSEVFVNYGDFSLQSARPILNQLAPTWDRPLATHQHDWVAACQERFWNQLVRLQAETYLAEGDNLICVTRNEETLDALREFFPPAG